MKELFEEVIRINQMEDNAEKSDRSEKLFSRINQMQMPESFNWATEVFEGLHVAENPDKLALIWSDLAAGVVKKFSYQQLSHSANQLVNYFSDSGLSKGDHLYLMSPMLPQNWMVLIGCIKAGVVSVPTPVSMTQRELEYRFETCFPDMIIADEASTDLIDQALEAADVKPKVKMVIGSKAGWQSFDVVEQADTQAEGAMLNSEDILFCFFTSGTTGLPKRVGHTAVSYPIGHLASTVMIGVRPDDIHANLSATGWAKWTWSSFFAPLNVGATFLALKGDHRDEPYLEALIDHQVSTYCAHPTAWRRFAAMNLDELQFPSLRQALSAGEPLRRDIHEKLSGLLPVKIREFYGQTESTAMIGIHPWEVDQFPVGSLGSPCTMYDMALADDEGNQITEPDQVGHIVVKLDRWRAAGLFSEYIGSPEKMSSVFVDNYYYTGDRGSFDESGCWWFVGRADDVIKSSDYRIGPFEVESALGEHPAVAEVAVVGSPDPNRYQLVKAYVILGPTFEPSREMALALFKHTITILPKFKIPRIIEFVDEVPKTFSGKIRRVELRQMETARYSESDEESSREFFYWDFPELSTRKE